MTLTNCDLNEYTYTSYKPLQDCDCRPKKDFTKQPFYTRIKMLIFLFYLVSYSKLYYVLLDLKKVVISICFNVTIYIDFEFLNY